MNEKSDRPKKRRRAHVRPLDDAASSAEFPEGGLPFSRYHLLKRLSYGGMGEIFLAKHDGIGGFSKLLVIKRLGPGFVVWDRAGHIEFDLRALGGVPREGHGDLRLEHVYLGDDGFRVLDGFTRIVRLGEGLSTTGRLSDLAMSRTIDALRQCRNKLREHEPARRAATRRRPTRSTVSQATGTVTTMGSSQLRYSTPG